MLVLFRKRTLNISHLIRIIIKRKTEKDKKVTDSDPRDKKIHG
jgi:hypothetical protein